MENKEFTYQGKTLNGILMLVLNIIGFLAGVGLFIFACVSQEGWLANVCGVCGVLLLILSIICVCGFILVEPGQARVLLFFGKYRGTFTEPGYYWLNPFISQKKLSLRVRNLDAEPIKVNDKTGNPIMIGMVLVWKLKDTYKAIFEIDTQTMAEGSTGQAGIGASAAQIMNMLGRFVQIQADAALRQVAGQYAYDDDEGGKSNQITLRDGSDEINKELEKTVHIRADIALAETELFRCRIAVSSGKNRIAGFFRCEFMPGVYVYEYKMVCIGGIDKVLPFDVAMDHRRVKRMKLSNDRAALGQKGQ